MIKSKKIQVNVLLTKEQYDDLQKIARLESIVRQETFSHLDLVIEAINDTIEYYKLSFPNKDLVALLSGSMHWVSG